ncbi:LptF/LptG family permease [Eilatimonas milleporae]|uniref:Lipopolysaccharide export system permease protein n=1 Tax=Eilatimonas milleporae TaxID=911205 RepID=A0A3M0C3P4_9PROT|nr:LptF/LptG family permease [Eilatimonas milleporae]RMB01436.1 lipopolysaccharide export system permease protein [Eilatimonas milleporae]
MAFLDRYLLRTAFTPLAVSLFVAALLLLLEQMLRLLDFVLHENGPVDVVWRMLAFLVPHYLSLALPLSVFLGVVLAFRRLSLSSELDSMQATGISPWRLIRPLMMLSLLMMLLNFLLLAYVQPYARYAYHQLRYELQAGLLGARVPVGKFVDVADGVKLRIGRTENQGQDLIDLFVVYENADGDRSTFTARQGRFVRSSDPNILLLRLFRGRQMVVRPGERLPGVLNFDQQDIALDLPDVTAFRGRGGEKREATMDELLTILSQETQATIADYDSYRASFHFRIIHTLTFLALPFLAASVGVSNRRQPSSIGPILGLGLVIIYHELLEEWAESAVSSGSLSPYVAMWPLYAVFLLVSLRLFYRMAEQPGRGGLRQLETLIARISHTAGDRLKRLIGKAPA